jgi:recombination protein RecA
MDNVDGREMALKQVMDEINKKYGEGAIVKGADAKGLVIQRLRTGSLALDFATGGGWAMGHMNEVYGPWSGGKTYISLTTLAETQRAYPDAKCAWIDFEGCFDEDWAEKVGVNTTELLISSPETMEDGLQIASMLIQSGDVALLIIDSLAAASPKAELEGEMGDSTIGLRARVGNKFVRKYSPKTNILSDEVDLGRTTLLIINQEYQQIGAYAGPPITPCGDQVKFGSLVRVRVRRGELLQDKDGSILMQESKFVVEKNKTHSAKQAGSFSFSTKDNPKGKAGELYRAGEIITFGTLTGVIRKSGAWLYLPDIFGELKFQGAPALADWIADNSEEYRKLESLVVNEMPNLR